MVDEQSLLFKCLRCGYEIEEGNLLQSYCPRCNGILGIEYREAVFRIVSSGKGVWRYQSLLPPIRSRVSLGEGLTPLSRVRKLLVKNERFNPTGSYADRASALIASYVKDLSVERIVAPYVRDFTRSLTYYLISLGVEVGVKVSSIFDIELDDIVFFSLKSVNIFREINTEVMYVDYVNPLTIEGLKTIVFEVYEKRVDVERIVVPAETGLLALSIQKGLRDLQISGCEFNCEVVAAKIKGIDAPLLNGVQGIHVVEVMEDEVYEAYKKFVSKGFKTKPLATLSYYVAELLGNALAVVTMGFISPSRGRSIVKKHIVEILSKKSPLTAYEIWKEKPIYTLRAIYKAVKDMETRGELCFDIAAKGKRKIKLYKICK
ncbi:MAG: pyridoxal-5'-phosphate-dependent protein subunit beta [Ignisphaera sp.]|uniref:Pyridoxal-5'-phosphate-dependent protein subunit beta n=1 Tax=Ignisphaera aggregans TaxID=334771 RepID=A0A7C4NMW5_9CREN